MGHALRTSEKVHRGHVGQPEGEGLRCHAVQAAQFPCRAHEIQQIIMTGSAFILEPPLDNRTWSSDKKNVVSSNLKFVHLVTLWRMNQYCYMLLKHQCVGNHYCTSADM